MCCAKSLEVVCLFSKYTVSFKNFGWSRGFEDALDVGSSGMLHMVGRCCCAWKSETGHCIMIQLVVEVRTFDLTDYVTII
jgi:hypothetical protein